MLDLEAIYQKSLRDLEIKENKDSILKEVESVNSLSRKLFDHEINKDTTELFRAMCILSQCSTKLNTEISSHRPLVGKLIVTIKKIIWRFVSPQIEKTFSSIQDCFSYLIISHANCLSELKALKESKSTD